MAATRAGKLPPMMAFPPADVRKAIPKEEWQICVQSWTFLSHAYLSLPHELFEAALSTDQDHDGSVTRFLTSYMSRMRKADTDENYLQMSSAADLRRSVFLIVHRLAYETPHAATAVIIDWQFLGDFSRVYRGSSNLMPVLEKLWSEHESSIVQSLSNGYKHDIVTRLESGKASAVAEDELLTLRLLPLIRACPSAGLYLLTGSDFSDAVVSAYPGATAETRSRLLLLLYLCLSAPLRTEKQNISLLFDHIYSLKTTAQSDHNPLLTDLVSNTPFLSQFRKLTPAGNDQRAKSLAKALEEFRNPHSTRPKKPTRRRIDKGKARENTADTESTTNGIHVHRMSLVTQIQDLFPDLGSAFILKLLDEYADDIETATAHLLENDLPPHLRSLDRSEDLPLRHSPPDDPNTPHPRAHSDLAPRTTPPPQPTTPTRHNIHDNDPLDNLDVPSATLHIGRRDNNPPPRSPTAHAASKAAILSALSAFDADDDERDDTYDIADVGGTIDTREDDEPRRRGGGGGIPPTDHDALLLAAYKADASVFARDAATRRGAARRALRAETGMTDEGVEGWGVMLAREPGRLGRLEGRVALGGALQRGLGRTAWRGGGATTTDEEEEEEGEGTSSGGEVAWRGKRGAGADGRGRGRGRGSARGDRAGVAGVSGDAGTQRARQRKEASKGSRANHNRRAQRAKKMARGGLPG